MSTMPEILAAAQNLSPLERSELVHAIWETLPVDQWPLPSAAWIEEVQRRSAAVDAGTMTTVPWREARLLARRKAGLDG